MMFGIPVVQRLLRNLSKRSPRGSNSTCTQIRVEELERRVLLASALVEGGKLLFNNDTDAEQNDLTLSLTDSGRSLMLRDAGTAVAAGRGMNAVRRRPARRARLVGRHYADRNKPSWRRRYTDG